MSAPLPLAVVGGGLVGQRHAALAAASDAVRLTAVVEPDPSRRGALAARGLPVVADLADVPPETRAAIVATPTPDHVATGLAALSRGWAVLVEKPLAAALAEADVLIAAAGNAGLPLFTGHHRRCHAFVAAAEQRLAEIAPLVAVQGIWSLRKPESYFAPDWRRAPGSGPIMTNLSHEFDLLRRLAGEIDAVSAMTSNAARGLTIEDTAAITLRFASGALGSFVISDAGASPWAFEAASGENPLIAPSGEDYLRFAGTRGSLAFPSLTLWQADPPERADWGTPLSRRDTGRPATSDPLAEQLARFAAAADRRPHAGLATAEDGRAALALTLATLLAAETGRPVAPAEVPHDYRGLAQPQPLRRTAP